MLTEVYNNFVRGRVYGKLFEQMYDGTLATKGPWQALVTFQQLIILADKNGEVDMTTEAIARRTTIPLAIISEGLSALEQPDPESRSPALEGRRIVRLSPERSWGWSVVNYQHYRKIRSQEERREYMRAYQRKRREAVKDNVNKSTGGKQNQPIAVSSKQYAVSSKQEEERSKAKVAALPLPAWLNVENWTAYTQTRPSRARKPEALKSALEKLAKFKAEGHDPNEIVATSLANGWQGLFAPDAKRGKVTPIAERPSRVCGACGKRAFTWTGDKCDPCWRKEQGTAA